MTAVTHTLTFVSGETTCASEPGKFCKFLYTKNFGTSAVCHLFDDNPLFEHTFGEKKGWIARCHQCMKQFSSNEE